MKSHHPAKFDVFRFVSFSFVILFHVGHSTKVAHVYLHIHTSP